MKESLEHHEFEELEPEHYYDEHGLWLPKQKKKPIKKGEIDAVFKKIEKKLQTK